MILSHYINKHLLAVEWSGERSCASVSYPASTMGGMMDVSIDVSPSPKR